ncbi:DUF421 domain-containing protein [Clostridium tyrobutyricum]|uniref:DUF421 domain-containing protein n=1 Tax=Clostridium tyrobutyricum TaxID=1519 RepID=UPI001C3919CD|nr:DUF421 domain-containing protein [Clostridium tyrobutyricum]MBV4418874.1 DUF421 domain-containing protein [Clostridium tyrobutyricum]
MQNWIMVILRSAILFFLTLAIVRIYGKGNLSKLTPFRMINYIVVAIIVTFISLGLVSNVIFAFLVLGVWVLFSLIIDYLSLEVKWIHDFVYGNQTVLIKDGKVMEENLKTIRYTGDELLRDLRSKNIFNLADVQFAVMETTGEVNVLLKSDKKPVTSHDLKVEVAPISEPETVILNGKIIDGALSNRGLNREWLQIQLSNFGVILENVFIGQVDSSGDLFIDTFDDSIQIQQPKVKELLYASISKVQADLFAYSLETDNPEAKKMYSNNASTIKRLMDKLEPYLLR